MTVYSHGIVVILLCNILHVKISIGLCFDQSQEILLVEQNNIINLL